MSIGRSIYFRVVHFCPLTRVHIMSTTVRAPLPVLFIQSSLFVWPSVNRKLMFCILIRKKSVHADTYIQLIHDIYLHYILKKIDQPALSWPTHKSKKKVFDFLFLWTIKSANISQRYTVHLGKYLLKKYRVERRHGWYKRGLASNPHKIWMKFLWSCSFWRACVSEHSKADACGCGSFFFLS